MPPRLPPLGGGRARGFSGGAEGVQRPRPVLGGRRPDLAPLEGLEVAEAEPEGAGGFLVGEVDLAAECLEGLVLGGERREVRDAVRAKLFPAGAARAASGWLEEDLLARGEGRDGKEREAEAGCHRREA